MSRLPRTVGGVKNRKMALLEALKKAMGVISTACEMCGENRRQYYKWMDTDKKFNKEVKEIEERCLDFAETALFKNIQEGKEKSILFYLSTKGKQRGYTQQIEHKGEVDHKHITGFQVQVCNSREDVQALREKNIIDIS